MAGAYFLIKYHVRPAPILEYEDISNGAVDNMGKEESFLVMSGQEVECRSYRYGKFSGGSELLGQ